MLDTAPIKARLAAATPAPWAVLKEGSAGFLLACGRRATLEPDGFNWAGWLTFRDENDAQLAANAPTDLAALVAEVERLRAAEAFRLYCEPI